MCKQWFVVCMSSGHRKMRKNTGRFLSSGRGQGAHAGLQSRDVLVVRLGRWSVG